MTAVDLPAVEERAAALRGELARIERRLDRLSDPPEPLTAGELAASSAPTPVRIPEPPPFAPAGSLVAAAGAVRSGEVSAVELVERALERARAASGLNAFLLLRGEAVEEARRRDGGGAGPLLGVPLTVKDIVDVRGLPTTSGSKFPRHATASAPAWEALESAGAVLLGKTNLVEWAFGVHGDNPTFGRTRNPHDPTRIPGGSSSGSAASVAVGAGYGSVGTDTGGSIRIPAAFTGIFGLKPTYGAVSRTGVTPLSWSLDHVGPMARTAADLDALWRALAPGRRHPSPPPVGPGSTPLRGVRIGVPRNHFFSRLAPEARAAADRVRDALEGLGAESVPVDAPEVELAGPARTAIAFAEAARFHAARLDTRAADFSPEIRMLLEVGARLGASDYLTALRARRAVTDGFLRAFTGLDAWLTPSIPAGAPVAGEPLLATGEPLRTGTMRFIAPFNLTGFPALALPSGRDPAGMPLGAQLVGPPGREEAVLRLARFAEAAGATQISLWTKSRGIRAAMHPA